MKGLLALQQPDPRAIRAQGFGYVPPMQSPAVPPQVAPQGAPQAPTPAQGMGLNQMKQVYGLLAGGADDPTQVGMQYVNAVQHQQQMQSENSQMGQLLKLYGTVNPRDWTVESLSNFHKNFVENGTVDYNLLERYKGMSSVVEKEIIAADNAAAAAADSAAVAGDLADRYLDAHRRGNFRQGLAGAFDTWITRNITGNYDSQNALKQDFTKFVNEMVIKGLPPGVASDRDIKITQAGWPPATASPEYMAAYMNGIKKLKIIEHTRAAHRSNYLGINKDVTGAYSSWAKNQQDLVRNAFRYHGLGIDTVDSSVDNQTYAAQKYGSQVRPVPAPRGDPNMSGAVHEEITRDQPDEVSVEDINYWSSMK